MIETVAHYKIEAEIGRGGMGIVYRATDTRLGRPVAIKMLPAEVTADAERHRRFVQEARAASALNHPNIVTIHDIDEQEGATLIAMELLDGSPLDQLLTQGPLPLQKVLEYATQVAAALEVAHSNGIIHRDLKPANIWITRDGRAKVLDFGLAKLLDHAPSESTMTALTTQPGQIMGTAAYMSPEQIEGRPVHASSDIFSFGVVLYEMLTGGRPFKGNSKLGIITAILRDQPPPLRNLRTDAPPGVQAIVDRCLAKDPSGRYQSAGQLRTNLVAEQLRMSRGPHGVWRNPVVLAALALLLAAIGGIAVWQAVQARRARWARERAIPEIENLQQTIRSLDAFRLARQAERLAPDEIARVRQRWYPLRLTTNPEGARIEVRNYLDLDGPWEALGTTPLRDWRLPFGYYRVRITRPGYVPLDIANTAAGQRPLQLTPGQQAVPGMVRIPGGPFSVGIAGTVTLPDFWMDRLEVSNRQFKQFVDALGYRDPRYWKAQFLDGGRALSFAEAMARFRDATGRTGPATWELGSYPDGRGDFPVGGVSWFEAAAYAEFAGKSLPTLYHWYRAAPPDEISSDILRVSNFDGQGPVRAGERQGLGRWGTLDMAGNVKEWCVNPVEGTNLRYILGGGWDEPSYRYTEPDARNPWDRQPTFGLRAVKDLGSSDEAAQPVAHVYGDPKSLVPVSDALFEVYRRFYAYDRSPLNARVDSVEDSGPHWRMETVSFDAGYPGERIPATLFLPRNASPPYQTVVLFPSAYALVAPSSRDLDYSRFDFIIRSGRALLYPVYQGTFERRRGEPSWPSGVRDVQVQWAKDFFRAVDYLETRTDIDMGRLGYYSLSMGAYFGPIPVSLEPRIKVAVFASGGLRFNYPPEIQPANFAPRVKVPVLLVNGRDDFGAPLDCQRRLLELLGTPAENKRHVVLEGGHVPTDNRGVIREVLDWFDKYLGPVK